MPHFQKIDSSPEIKLRLGLTQMLYQTSTLPSRYFFELLLNHFFLSLLIQSLSFLVCFSVSVIYVSLQAEKILRIPLAEEPHDDFRAWSGEPSGEYTVRSAYKLLQSIEGNPTAYVLQADYKEFYKKKKLWLLNLPSKVKITIWKISWNYLHIRVNMLQREVTNTTICPRCGIGTENMDHLFRECPVSVLVWRELSC